MTRLTLPPAQDDREHAGPGAICELSTTTRRAFLRGASALSGIGTAALLRGPIAAQSRRVIVVGAGMAGIAAARSLEDNGLDVIVLEARSRIGGRIWTDRSWGVPLDRGASWIHGAADPNPIWRLANRFGLRTVMTDWEDIVLYDVNGQRISASQAATDERRYQKLYQRARRWGNGQEEDSSLQDGFDEALGSRTLSAHGRRALDFSINFNIEQDYGGDASDLSNWWYDQDSWLGGRQDAMMRDGYGPLVDILAEGLDIRTSSPVRSISHGNSGVTVSTDEAEFRGAFAVVTLPL